MEELPPQLALFRFSFSSPVSVGGYKNAGRKEADADATDAAPGHRARMERREEGRKEVGRRAGATQSCRFFTQAARGRAAFRDLDSRDEVYSGYKLTGRQREKGGTNLTCLIFETPNIHTER